MIEIQNQSETNNLVTNKIKSSLSLWLNEINKFNLRQEISNFKEQSIFWGLWQFLINWLIIIYSFKVFIALPFIFPVAVLIIGSRQRALSNLVHDGSHFNVVKNSRLNDLLTDIFAGIPMLSFVKNYRKSHKLHHKFLGNINLDPDLKTHLNYGYNDYNPPYKKWWQNYFFLVANLNAIKDSTFGEFFLLPLKKRLIFALWIFIFSILFFPALNLSCAFWSFWFFSRITSYHFIRITAEFIDHSGLKNETIFDSCRIINNSNFIIKILIHPHNDNLHALHHLEPKIPSYNLNKAHKHISKFDTKYSKIHKNNGYFIGSSAAIKDLVGEN